MPSGMIRSDATNTTVTTDGVSITDLVAFDFVDNGVDGYDLVATSATSAPELYFKALRRNNSFEAMVTEEEPN
jgi:hypothetical protein